MISASTVAATTKRPPADGREGVLDVLPAGVVLVDERGRVTDCNPAAEALLGTALRGASWHDVVARMLSTRASAPGEEAEGVRLASGRSVSVVTAPLGDRRGQVILLTDVTAVDAARTAIARQRRLAAMGQTIAGLSHQLRTPLASALLYVSQLEQPALPAAQRERSTAKLRDCLDHLDHLVRDLLAWAGGGVLRAGDFAVSELLTLFRDHAAAPLAGSGCRLDVILEAGDARLRGNRDALLTALQAILENAVQACAEASGAGHLRLLCRRADAEALEITLSDDGAGMPADLRRRAAQPFVTGRAQGTGLGLAVAEAVAQAHGGVLWIDSEEGLGTTVGLRLPLARSRAGAPRGVPKESPGSIAGSRETAGENAG